MNEELRIELKVFDNRIVSWSRAGNFVAFQSQISVKTNE